MKKSFQCLFIIALAFSMFHSTAISQSDYQRFGIFGSFNIYQHRADFRTLPGVISCCPKYIDGTGTGFSLGFLYEYPIKDGLFLAVRAGFLKTAGKFQTDEVDTVNLNGNYTDGIFRHTIKTDFSDIAIQPMIQWRFWDNFLLHGGFELAFGKFSNSFSHSEEIIQPLVGTYENDKRTRLLSSGNIKEISTLTSSLMAGLSYEFALNAARTWFLAPEAFFFLGLQNNVKDVSWKTNSFRFGLALKFSPTPTHKSKEYLVDTVQIRSNKFSLPIIIEGKESFTEKTETTESNEKIIIKQIHRTDTLFTPALIAKLVTTAIDEDGTRSKVSEIHVSTQFVTEVFPVLPYIFFERKSSQMPSRYETVNNPQDFNIDLIEQNPITIQRNILNIIGKRMLEKPGTTITLLGTADPTTENGDCNLASTRAQVVRNYLVKTFALTEDRIILKPLKEPCPPSAITQTQNEDGFADNRRVEISSNDKDLLQSIPSKRFNEPYKVTPPVIEHDPTGSSTEGIVSWLLVGSQGSHQIFSKSGDGPPTKFEHKISNKAAMDMKVDMPVSLTYIIKDKDGNNATATEEFKVTKDTSDVEIKRLSLTVFNVGSAEVTKTAGDEINKFLQNPDNDSQVEIIGYTDRLGDENFNINLSKNRANSIRDYVQKIAPNAKITSTTGVAFNNYPPGISSYSTPEERFLSRTVQIEVRHKVRK